MKVHIKVIEGKDIPIMDIGGLCDPYCIIKYGKQKAQTRIIDNTLIPRWRQEFSFDVIDPKNDSLFIQLYDHDTIGKDEIIADLTINSMYSKPGEIINEWFNMRPIVNKTTPKVRLVIHLAQEKDEKFVSNPFKLYLTNIRIMTVKDIEPGEYTVSLGYKKELMLETRKSNDLIWQEEFSLSMPQDEPVLLVNLIKAKKIISFAKIFTGGDIGKIEKKWHQMKDKGSIKIAYQINTLDAIPFSDEKFDDEFEPPTELTAYFRFFEGRNLTPMDSNGKNDAYCTVANLTKPKIIKKTQILYESINPKWNYFINMKIYDYETDVIRISCYDYDLIGSNDLIGFIDIPVKDMGFGNINDEWLTIKNNDVKQGELHIMYQICSIGWIPFSKSLRPLCQINVHIMDGYDIPNTDIIGKTDPYVRVKLNDQEFVQKTKVINNTLNPCWDQTIKLYSLCEKISMQIELKDEATGKDPLIGTKDIDLSELKYGEIIERTEELIPAKGMKKGGKLHFYIQQSSEPFKNYEFKKYIDTGKKTKRGNGNLEQLDKSPTKKPLTLYVKIVRAYNLKSCDSNGLSDPYCILQINNQKKTTSIIYECLNPKWDEYFIFDLNSLNDDILTLICMDYDLLSSDDLIGSVQIPMKSLIFGKINEFHLKLLDKENKNSGEIEILLHVAKMGDIPFEEKLWNQKVLNIRIMEGNNLPNGNLYWIGKLDIEKEPQFISTQKSIGKWMEQYQIKYSYENEFILKLYEHGKKERELDEIRIPYKSLKQGELIDKTFTFGKNLGIHLILELNEFGYPSFATLPELDINKEKLFLCDALTLNIKIIEAKNLPIEKSETYCRLYLLGIKPKEKIGEVRTKNSKKGPTPFWNEEYHFPIRSLGTDVLYISLKERGTLGKENSLSYYNLNIRDIPYGTIVNAWFKFVPEKGITKGGSVHIKYQLAGPGNYAFINKPFTVKSLYIKIVEGKEIRGKDFNGLADPYCQMQIIGDRRFVQTNIINGNLSPFWNENFSFLITNYETDTFRLNLKDNSKLKDVDIGFIELKINQFEIGKVYNKWLQIKNNGNNVGLIRTTISVIEPGIEPFKGEIIEDKVDIPPSPIWQINIHLLNANYLPSADSNGLSDPYCLFTILNTKTIIKSRKIDKTLNPIWDDYFQIPFKSLNSDILRLEIIDWDRFGKHDKLCMRDFPLTNFQPGKIYADTYSLIPLEGRKSGSIVTLKLQITPPSTIPFQHIEYIPDQLNIRIEDIYGVMTKKPLKDPKLFFNLRLESDNNEGFKSMIKNELNSIIKESFDFLIMDKNKDKLIIEYQNEVDKNKAIANAIIPLNNLDNGLTKEMNVPMNPNGNLHLFLQIDKKNEIPFKDAKLTPLSNPYMTFYIKIISGRNIKVADDTGLSDPFCILQIKNRKEKQKTATKIQTLTPVWNQTFQFKILSYNTDVFILTVYDYDKYSKNDLLGEWEIPMKKIKPGIVEQCEVEAGGLILVKYHLAYPGEPAFVDKPFNVKILNIKVLEGKDIQTSNISALADLYCQMYIVGDIEYSKTNIKYQTLSPIWNETFSFLTANYQTDIFRFELKEKGKDNNIGDINLEIKEFEVGKVYKRWLKLQNKGKLTGLIKVEINVIEKDEMPFSGEIIEEKMEFRPSENWEFNVHIIKANNLPSADSNGLSDPYCLFKILNRDISIKSRRIDKTLNPIWDDYIKIPIISLNSDIVRLEIIDWDRIGKDDKLCMKDFRLKDYIPGKIYHETYSLIPLAGNKGGSTVELRFFITPPSSIPFTDFEYDIEQLNVRIEDISSFIPNSPLKNPKLYVNIKLDIDSDEGYLTDTKDDLNSQYKEDFSFIIMDKGKENLLIEYKNETDNTIIGKCLIPLNDLQFGKTKEINSSLNPSGNAHLFLEINKKDILPFQDINLSSHINPYTTLYFSVISGIDIPVADNTGLSDPFCILELQDRKIKKSTLIRKQTLTPVWNQTFHFKILSYNSDIFKLTLFDYDKFSKNDYLGEWKINIRDIKPGVVEDKIINAGGKIHIKYHLAYPNQPQWENIEKPAYHLNIKVIEAKEFPNNTGITDPFVQLYYKDDIVKQRTSTLDNTLTPQWFQQFYFSFIDLNEPLIIRLIDDNILKNSEMAELKLKKLDKYELNYIYDEWIKMTPLENYKIGGKIRLEFQFTDYNTKPFEGPKDPGPSYPISETKMTFNIKIHKGFNIENSKFTKDTYCKLEYIGIPNSVQKTRIIQNSSTPFWDEFHQFDIYSLNDIFMISLCDSKDQIISYYLINLKDCDFGITKEEELKMMKNSSSVDNPGNISVTYQIAKPCQEIFFSEKFNVDKITCFIQSFENAIQGEEYFCEVKTIDSPQRQTSTITTDNLIMEKFEIYTRKSITETLEIIIYQLEKKGKFKYSKEIKHIKYPIEEIGEHEIDGVKFTLQMNEDSNEKYPEHPPITFPKRYVHLYIEECIFKDLEVKDRVKNSYIKVALNKNKKQKRYSDKTRIINKDDNPKFKHIFHIPVFSLKEDIISLKVYQLNEALKKKLVNDFYININDLKRGESTEQLLQKENVCIKLKIHLCEENCVPFVTQIFRPLYLCIKFFEIELEDYAKLDISFRMKNDITNSNKLIVGYKFKKKEFGGKTFVLPISNKDDTYFIELLYYNSDKIYKSNEYETRDLEPYIIYRTEDKGMRFWTQIVNEGESPQFDNKKFYNYYNQLPAEYYMVYLEVIEFSNMPCHDSDEDGDGAYYYELSFGTQNFKSRKLYSREFLIFNDEHKLKAENLEQPINFVIHYDGYVDNFKIDLTAHEFGKIVENTYDIRGKKATIKWQITEPCQPRWEERNIKINNLNLHIGKYETPKDQYEFWKIKFETIEKKTIATPYGSFEETFSFILTNQIKIQFIQYFLDSDNHPKENKKIDFNISDIKSNEPFYINEDLTGIIEIAPYEAKPFQGKIFSQCFKPKTVLSLAILLINVDGFHIDDADDLNASFKFKDRDFEQKSMKISKPNELIWNQYFNFNIKSFKDDILVVYAFRRRYELGKKEIKISSIYSSQNLDVYADDGYFKLKLQVVPPNTVPFSQFDFDIDKIYIKFLYGENIKKGDLFCQCKLTDDLIWEKTNSIKSCQNPQWNQIIFLPFSSLSGYVEIEVISGLIKNTKLGYYKIGLELISDKPEKKTISLNQGSVHFLIMKTKNLKSDFDEYEEEIKKITVERATVAVQIKKIKEKLNSLSSSSAYCLLKLGNEEQKTRCIDYNYYPEWNELFYLSIPSYSTSELSIKIVNKLNKNNVLYETKIPIKNMTPGKIEAFNDKYLDMVTQLIGPGEISFEEVPFKIKTKIVKLESLQDNKNIYCMIKLKDDEYWRYSKFGKFLDFFYFEYIDQTTLTIKSTDGQNYSEEINLDLNESKEEIIKNSLGNYKINFVDEIIFEEPSTQLSFNMNFQRINNIQKENDVYWIVEINNISTGYSYDGSFNKYFSFPINSLLSDEYNIILYKEKKGKRKEYGKAKILINQFKIGIIKEDIISIEGLSCNFTGFISLANTIPFKNIEYYPLIMHIGVIEAYNFPTKSDLFVLCRLERDQSGPTTKVLDKTSTPQWYEFIHFIITDENEDLIVEIRNKAGKKSKLICETKLNLKKYLDGNIYFEWLKMDKVNLNIALQIKKENEKYMEMDDIYNYIDSSIPDNN